MERYKIQKVIGDGTYGVVYRGTNIATNELVAIKKMKKKFTTWEECTTLREIKALTKLNHPNIVKLKEVVKVKDDLYLVFEYLDQNLYQLYSEAKEKGKQLPESQIRSIIYQTVAGLAYMHKHGFFHRDLKPENLLLMKDAIKVCDFGLAREIRSRPPFTDYVATRWYRAPEIILKSTNYNSPVDIFAIGCIMAELYTGTPLFCGNSEMDQLVKTLAVLGTPTQTQWPEGYRLAKQSGWNFPSYPSIPLQSLIPSASQEAIALLGDMLRFEAEKRPGASQILQHPYFAGFIPPTITEPMVMENAAGDDQHVNFASGNEKPQGEGLQTDKSELRSSKREFHKPNTQVIAPPTMIAARDAPLPATKALNLDDSFDIEREINSLLKEESKAHGLKKQIRKPVIAADTRSYSQDPRLNILPKPAPSSFIPAANTKTVKDDDLDFASRMNNQLYPNQSSQKPAVGIGATKQEDNIIHHAPSHSSLRSAVPPLEKKALPGLSNMTNQNAQKLMSKLASTKDGYGLPPKSNLGMFTAFPSTSSLQQAEGVTGRYKM